VASLVYAAASNCAVNFMLLGLGRAGERLGPAASQGGTRVVLYVVDQAQALCAVCLHPCPTNTRSEHCPATV